MRSGPVPHCVREGVLSTPGSDATFEKLKKVQVGPAKEYLTETNNAVGECVCINPEEKLEYFVL